MKEVMQQYTLPLRGPRKYHADDFIFSSCNAELRAVVDNISKEWGHKPYPEIILLVGPKASGKTHFCNLIHQRDSSVMIIDDIDAKEEVDIFHAFNSCHENNQRALFTCKEYKKFNLPDLKSRLASVKVVSIDLPDDLMMKSLLIKALTERSIKVSDEVIKFLLTRVPRSFAAVESSVELIDRLSIEQKRNISTHFLSSINLNLDEL